MINRRALMAAGALAPLPVQAQLPPWYATGTKQREVRFAGASGVTLAGTLLLPLRSEIQGVPGVVLIAGSGPTDRDGNNPLIPLRIDLLREIAERLADAGVASLRYDKRGIGRSTQRPAGSLEEQERFFHWDNFVADAVSAHAELLRHGEIKPYASAFLGHSEGGLLALAACEIMAARRPHALVLASTPGRPLNVIVREQIARNAPGLSESAERVAATIAATGHVPAEISPQMRSLFPTYAGPFLQAALAFDPAQALARLDNACLLIHGAADNQIVPLGDIQPLLDVLGRRKAPGEALVIPAVSHNLKAVTAPGDPGFAGPLSPAAGDKLAQWLGYALGA